MEKLMQITIERLMEYVGNEEDASTSSNRVVKNIMKDIEEQLEDDSEKILNDIRDCISISRDVAFLKGVVTGMRLERNIKNT